MHGTAGCEGVAHKKWENHTIKKGNATQKKRQNFSAW